MGKATTNFAAGPTADEPMEAANEPTSTPMRLKAPTPVNPSAGGIWNITKIRTSSHEWVGRN